MTRLNLKGKTGFGTVPDAAQMFKYVILLAQPAVCSDSKIQISQNVSFYESTLVRTSWWTLRSSCSVLGPNIANFSFSALGLYMDT